MSPVLVLASIGAYFAMLMLIAWYTSRHATSATFFSGNRQSPWYVVAYGMIGASLSGVTFVSVPGGVGVQGFGGMYNGFAYFQLVLGYLVGYAIIARVLLPLYYRLNLISIYTYLESRFGPNTYRTGAFFFLISRTLGSSLRLYLAASILHFFVFEQWGVAFWQTVVVTLVFIWAYTFRGGIRTVVWTDTLQTTFMLLAVVLTIGIIIGSLNWSVGQAVDEIWRSPYSDIFFGQWQDKRHFVKQFVSGALISLVMTGLDQDMMQKNLTCRTLEESQYNMNLFSRVLVLVNLMFLGLGALLYLYAAQRGIQVQPGDEVFPQLAREHLGPATSLIFILGIIAAAYSSADSALTALTTSFCVDILGIDRQLIGEARRSRIRLQVHIGFTALTLLLILLFRWQNDKNVLDTVLSLAGYTYGPLLGLFSFGLLSKHHVRDTWVPWLCILSPVVCWVLQWQVRQQTGYAFGYELLLVNGLITFGGLWMLRR